MNTRSAWFGLVVRLVLLLILLAPLSALADGVWVLVDTKVEEKADPPGYITNKDKWLKLKGDNGNLTVRNEELQGSGKADGDRNVAEYSYTWSQPPRELTPGGEVSQQLGMVQRECITKYSGWDGSLSAQFTIRDGDWKIRGTSIGSISAGGRKPDRLSDDQTFREKVPGKAAWLRRDDGSHKMDIQVTLRHVHYRRTIRYQYEFRAAP